MTIPNMNTLQLALIPGHAERLKKAADQAGNLAWTGMAWGVQHYRDRLYISSAITALTALGTRFFMRATPLSYVGAIATVAMTSMTVLMGKRLYDAAMQIQAAVQGGLRP